MNKLEEIELFVVAFQAKTQTNFSDRMMDEIPSLLLSLNERTDYSLIHNKVIGFDPDILVICGWFHAPYRKLLGEKTLSGVVKVLAMDTPWLGTIKQRTGIFLLRYYLLRGVKAFVVSGERSWQYAHRISGRKKPIFKAQYAVDFQNLKRIGLKRLQTNWPKRFLFVGRYSEEKGINVMVEAYRLYRKKCENPWELVSCGKGQLRDILNDNQVQDKGFLQPGKLEEVWLRAGVFVLPSRFDPWPLVIVEACAAGLPVICTDACGSAVELVRESYNGLIVPSGSIPSLARGMIYMHHNYANLSTWGARSMEMAKPYSAEIWTERWKHIIEEAQN